MRQLKTGDKVRRVAGFSRSLKKDTIYTVAEASNKSYHSITIREHAGMYYVHNFELVHLSEVTKDKSTMTKWSFHVNMLLEIEEDTIKQDLSKSNPVALVKSSCGVCSALYHSSLLRKARHLYLDLPPLVHKEEDFSKAIEWAKEVKRSSWGVPKKRTVTVNLPTI